MGKNVQNLKIWYFEKEQPPECDYRMHETARICPASALQPWDSWTISLKKAAINFLFFYLPTMLSARQRNFTNDIKNDKYSVPMEV